MPAGQMADVCVIPCTWVSVKTRRRLSRLLGGIGPLPHGTISLRFAATAPNRERGHVAQRRLPNNLAAPTGGPASAPIHSYFFGAGTGMPGIFKLTLPR